MTPTARSPHRYRPQPDVASAMTSPWSPTEKQFQSLVTDLAGRHGFACFHPFDSRRSAVGWPDLVLCNPPRLLFLELKVGKYQATDDQLRWLHLLDECGQEAYVVRSTGDQVKDAAAIVGLLRQRPAKVAA